MSYIRLTLTEKIKGYRCYAFVESSIDNLHILGHLLIDDIDNLNSLSRLKKYFSLPEFNRVGYEWTEIFKEGSKIILCDALFESGTEPDSFELPLDSFMNVLDEWEKILKLMPQKITIIQDGDKITFEYEK